MNSSDVNIGSNVEPHVQQNKMFLNKQAIQEAVRNGDISISDFNDEYLKAASYTLTLGPIDGKSTKELKPREFVLLETKEKVTLNGKYSCLLITPAYLAKQGIDVTQGSNFAEPDTDNTFILETSNSGNAPVTFTQGMKIVKVVFARI